MSTIVIAAAVVIGLGVMVWLFMPKRSGEQTLEVRPAAPTPIAPRPASRPSSAGGALIADELEKLWRLKQEGALTAEEFEDQKARLMGAAPADGLQVVLLDHGRNKIAVIKRVREITGCGLKEAKDLVESPPQVVAQGLNAAQADAMLRDFESDGARAEVR